MKTLYTIVIFCALLAVASCKKDKKQDNQDTTAATKSAVVANYSNIVYASYSDALTGAQSLKTAIDAFVAAPDATKLQACKDAWLTARISYNQTEPYRFYDGPIDNATGPEGLMNSWPLDENFIDYISSDATTGIINSSDPAYATIDVALIESLNTVSGEADVSTGWHAIEFLLWGQDLSTTGPGARPYTDYVTGGSGTASNQARRGDYLKAAAALLVTNLQYVTNQWAPGSSSNYRGTFESASVDESLKKIFQGAGFFSKGELSGERMSVALEEQLQEQEHSCFSDNTDNDIIYGAKGIQNVCTGKYTRINGEVIQGESIISLTKTKNATLGTEIEVLVAASVTLGGEIPSPFDQQILAGAAGGPKIQATITSLRSQADKLAQAASELGLGNITIE